MARTPPRAKQVTPPVVTKKPLGRRILYASAIFWIAVSCWFGYRWYRRHRGPDARPPGLVRCIAPVGDDATFDEFRWEFPLPPGGWYQLEVYDSNPAITIPIVKLDHLATPTWRPSVDSPPPWKDRIEWTVRVRDARGAEVEHGYAQATRKP